jgi:hypothetical protein
MRIVGPAPSISSNSKGGATVPPPTALETRNGFRNKAGICVADQGWYSPTLRPLHSQAGPFSKAAPIRRRRAHARLHVRPFISRASAASLTTETDSNGSSHPNTKIGRALRGLSSPWDREIFALAIPAMLSVLLDPVMGIVDTAIVGRLGTEPLAAVGMSTVIYNFSNFIWNFLLYTTTPRIAAAASRNDKSEVSKITSHGMWLAAFIGLSMTALLWTQCPAMFASMGASPEVLTHAVPYLRGRCIASPAILMFFVLAGTFRGFKDTK